MVEPNRLPPKVCIYCLLPIEHGQPREWLGFHTYAHRECYDTVAAEEPAPRTDARRRFA